MLRGVLIDDIEVLAAYWHAWDELAELNGLPYSSPAWVLSWWRHVAPATAQLRTVLVFDGMDLVGIAPFFVDRARSGLVRFRLLGSSRRDFVVGAELEKEMTAIVGEQVSRIEPSPDLIMIEGVPHHRSWPRLLSNAWPAGRMKLHRQFTQRAPSARLEGRTYDEWFQSKSHSFRKSMRRGVRQLEAVGGKISLTRDESELAKDLEAFVRLHHKRWKSRGGSRVLDDRVHRMLEDAAKDLIGQLRFRIWSIEIAGHTISSNIFLSAGGETAYWLGGFDEKWSDLQPSILTILAALEHGFTTGDSRLDLGAGAQPYKYRFSDSEDYLESLLIVRSGLKAPLARSQMLRARTRMALAEQLPTSTKMRVRHALRLMTPWRRST
jgi:CelD/BcsL family acetyltransferase involved in cellulose biosynthesis